MSRRSGSLKSLLILCASLAALLVGRWRLYTTHETVDLFWSQSR